MNYEELKRKAADIRDETQDAANTAERVGTVLIEMIGAVESVDNSIGDVQGAIPSTIHIAEYDVSMTHEDENRLYSAAEITLENSEGKVLAKERINGASDQYPGLMSIRKFKQVNAHESAIATLQRTILDLTKRIETLEKYHATNVENGTLETAANVVDGVMSVNGSVEDEILKL